MTKLILAMTLSFSSVTVATASVASAQASSQRYVTGVVEHVEAMENEALIKLTGIQQLLVIKNLMNFPEAKLQALMDSQETKTFIKLKVNEKNQILDVIL